MNGKSGKDVEHFFYKKLDLGSSWLGNCLTRTFWLGFHRQVLETVVGDLQIGLWKALIGANEPGVGIILSLRSIKIFDLSPPKIGFL